MSMTQGFNRFVGLHAARSGHTTTRLTPGARIPYAIVIGPVLVLAVWALGTSLGWIDPRVMSTPWQVLERAYALLREGRLQTDVLTSLTRAGCGLLLGMLAGGTLGIVAGMSRIGEALVDGPLQAKRAIPTLALIPLLVLWLGIGEEMKVVTIAIAVSLQMYLHTHTGLRTIDSRYVELAESLRLSRWKFIRRVVLPGALPEIINGLRHAITTSWLILIAVEQINSTSGVGHMMTQARSYGQTETIVVGLLVYGGFGLLSNALLRMTERRMLSWRRVLAA